MKSISQLSSETSKITGIYPICNWVLPIVFMHTDIDMKPHKHLIILLITTVLIIIQGCEHPLKDVEVEVDPDPFAYGVLLQITDEHDNPVSDVTVTIGGQDAEYIY